MEPSFDEYAAVLKSFYQKVSRYHSGYIQLNKDFGVMVTQFSKGDNASIRPKPRNRDRDDISATGSGHSHQNTQRSRSRTNRGNLKSTKSQFLFQNPSLGRVFVFAYLYYLIDTSNSHNFEMIDTKAKLMIETIPKQKINSIDPDPNKCAKIWQKDFLNLKKVMQLLSHKAKVRWERILRETLSEFHNIFVQILLRAILNLNSSTVEQITILPKDLGKISAQLKVSICYFDCEHGSILNRVDHGDYKYELKIGYMKADEKYAFFQKLPSDENNAQKSVNLTSRKALASTSQLKAKPDSSREVASSKNIKDSSPSHSDLSVSRKKANGATYNLTRRKAIRTINTILTEYSHNTKKMEELDCLKGESKEAKIKRLLEERRKG